MEMISDIYRTLLIRHIKATSVDRQIKLLWFVSEMNWNRVGIAVGLLSSEVAVENRATDISFSINFFLQEVDFVAFTLVMVYNNHLSGNVKFFFV